MIRFGGPILQGNGRVVKAGKNAASIMDDRLALVQKHKELGYRAAYVPRGISINDTEKIRMVRKAFEDADIMLAEAGYWEN